MGDPGTGRAVKYKRKITYEYIDAK